jgi:signal transduction histidine kinase
MATTAYAPQLEDARQEALADLGEIASRMAHEIRNPLNAIRMQVAVIRNKLAQPGPENLAVAKTQLERLDQEVLRVEKLAKAFLEFGRPPDDEPEEIWLTELLEDVLSLVRPEFEGLGHRLVVEHAPDGFDLFVRMDRAKLRQVFMNLLANSKNAMTQPGEVRIHLGRTGQHRASIRVSDSGCGIPEQDIPHIFAPFYSRSHQGEGLGLAIVKKIVDNAGGLIRVESQVGQGSCFEIILPLIQFAPISS